MTYTDLLYITNSILIFSTYKLNGYEFCVILTVDHYNFEIFAETFIQWDDLICLICLIQISIVLFRYLLNYYLSLNSSK